MGECWPKDHETRLLLDNNGERLPSVCKKARKCQIHANLIHVPPALLHNLTSPWPFCTWGIDIIGKVTPKASNGHEYILVAISYFTNLVEAASY